jgi:hypothetical protein
MDMLELARKRAAALEAELAELNVFMRTYAKLAPLAGPTQGAPNRAGSLNQQRAPAPDKPPSKRQQIENAAATALANEQPLTIPELLKRFKKVGVDVGGADMERNLSSYLSRSDRFENRRKDGGWFLSVHKEQAPEGGNLTGAQ